MSAESDFLGMVKQFLADDPCIAIYHKYYQGTYNSDTSDLGTTQADIPVQVLVQDAIRRGDGLSVVFGTDIIAGDKECFILPPNKSNPNAAPLTIDTAGDRITVGAYTYKVVNMKEANPTNADPILFQLLLRR